MANTSTIDLVKPAGTDYALVSTINGNMDKIDAEAAKERSNFAGTYSASSAYAVGDYCVYQGNLYRCTTAIGSGGEAWTAGHWAQVSVGEEITLLNGKSMSALVNGSNQGYVSFANGFMMQWGKATIPIGSDRVQVNFNPYYDHHIPMVTFTPEENGNAAGAVSDLRVFDTSYTKFVVYNKNGNVTNKDIIVNWIAIGTWSNI